MCICLVSSAQQKNNDDYHSTTEKEEKIVEKGRAEHTYSFISIFIQNSLQFPKVLPHLFGVCAFVVKRMKKETTIIV